MAFPKVTISEFIDGPRPVPLRSLNRVACVGTAKKGKYGAFILVSTDTDLDNKIGRTLHEGSVGLQTARDEGAFEGRSVRSLQRVSTKLVGWGGDGKQAAAMQRLQTQLAGVCAKVDTAEGQRAACEGLLKPAAKKAG